MSNTVNGDKQDRETRFYISVKEGTESSDSDIEFVQESNSSAIVLRPNQVLSAANNHHIHFYWSFL